jgi:hypothetical protein
MAGVKVGGGHQMAHRLFGGNIPVGVLPPQTHFSGLQGASGARQLREGKSSTAAPEALAGGHRPAGAMVQQGGCWKGSFFDSEGS